MNECGAGSLNLNALAEALGLSRNALYYYVSDRADLAFRCYLQSCDDTAEDLAVAYEQGAGPAERLRLYVERSLEYGRPPRAVLSDPDFLPEPHRTTIADMSRRNVESLKTIIAEGIADGAFRSIHVEIAAQTLQGMIDWARLSPRWLRHRDGPVTRIRLGAGMLDLWFFGVAASRDYRFECPIDIDVLISRPRNAFDRESVALEKVNQLIGTASLLFNRRGIDGTSIDDISTRLGLTKGTIYHYFTDKADLVLRCYDRGFDLYDAFMEAAVGLDRCSLDRLLTVLHLNCQAQAGPAPPLNLQPGFHALADSDRERFVERGRKLWRASQALGRKAIEESSSRPNDTVITGEASAGAFFWLSKWLPDDFSLTRNQTADEICNLFANGIVA